MPSFASPENLQEGVFLDGFCQMSIAAGIENLHSVLFQRLGSQGNYLYGKEVMFLLPRSNGSCRLIAIHHRHLHIHQDEIVVAGLESLHRDGAVIRDIDAIRSLFHIGTDEHLIVCRIFRQ